MQQQTPIEPVRIGAQLVGDGQPVFIVAEIGLNHNGDLAIAKQLIDLAVRSGCNAVKFQKRTPELCVPPEQRNVLRETPWGIIPYLEYRRKIEFGLPEYQAIDRYCREKNIPWFASTWDEVSLDFLDAFAVPCYKIASACLTNDRLLSRVRAKGKPVILSTGMSTLEQIDHAVAVLGNSQLVLLHCNSAYPAFYHELNLNVIPTLRDRYGTLVGYSGHESGLPSTAAAVALGACVIERHITLDRAMWGSDHAASLGPSGIERLVRDVRLVEESLGDGRKQVYPGEVKAMKRLRWEPAPHDEPAADSAARR